MYVRFVLRLLVLPLFLFGCGGGGGDSGGNSQAPQPKTEAGGVLDTTFGSQGIAVVGSNPTPGQVLTIAEYADGSLLAGGSPHWIAKFAPDGQLDPAFASAGRDTTSRATHDVQLVVALRILADQRAIVLEIDFNPCIGPVCRQVPADQLLARRIDARGQPDPTYGENGLRPTAPGHAAISPSGRIVAGVDQAMTGVDTEGRIDATFQANAAAATQCAPHLQVRSAGLVFDAEKLIVAQLNNSSGASSLCVRRLNADGSSDLAFGSNGRQEFALPLSRSEYRVLRVLVRGDGETIVFVVPEVGSSPPLGSIVVYLTPDGRLNATLNGSGMQLQPTLLPSVTRDVAIQENAKIVATGQSARLEGGSFVIDPDNPMVTRSSPTLSLFDAGFGPVRGGYVLTKTGTVILTPFSLWVARDGSIVVGGSLEGPGTPAMLRVR
jgi:hypothetical protein